jgi:hypothetical protein
MGEILFGAIGVPLILILLYNALGGSGTSPGRIKRTRHHTKWRPDGSYYDPDTRKVVRNLSSPTGRG